MIEITKQFKDSTDGLKVRKVGEKHDFGTERNKHIVSKGYAKKVAKKKPVKQAKVDK